MAAVSEPSWPHRSVDLHGRALRLTEEEVRQRNAEAIRALDEVAEMGDEEEQRATLEALGSGPGGRLRAWGSRAGGAQTRPRLNPQT